MCCACALINTQINYMYISTCILCYFLNCSFDSSIKVHTKPVPSAVDGGAQIQQMISIEVFKAFFEPPLLNVKLTLVEVTIIGCLSIAVHMHSLGRKYIHMCYNVISYCSVGGIPQSLVMKLPLLVHKLSEPADMAAADFFQRWKNLPR